MTLDAQTNRDISSALARSIRERGPRWAIRTLAAIAQMRAALPKDRPLEGRTAIVLGAGPSLDLAGPHLQRWQAMGAVIISTNTAARAAVQHGVQPDLVCFAETDPIVASHLESVHPGAVVVSTYCSQETIDAANQAAPGRVAFVFSPELCLFPLAYALGTEPLWHFGCVAVTCIAIARYLGCSRIILAGVDAAYTSRMYARGTPFEDLRPHVEQDLMLGPHQVEPLLITVSDRDTPSKRRSVQRAVMIQNNMGGQSLSEPQLLAPTHLFVPAARGCQLQTVSPHAIQLDGVEFLDCSSVEILGDPTRPAFLLKPIWHLDARSVLEQMEQRIKRWDPHDSVFAPADVPLASFWGLSRNTDPIKCLGANRQLMAEAKQMLLDALGEASRKPWP